MRSVGFSTGALAHGDFRAALAMLVGRGTSAVELSALREAELEPLMDAVNDLDLGTFRYVSVHTPSRLDRLSDRDVVRLLQPALAKGWLAVVHPDTIVDFEPWNELGGLACVENMDGRKGIGRTVSELSYVFDRLPDATMCFDIAHARQFDRTMVEAYGILRRFGGRIRQLHVSHVDSECKHHGLNEGALIAFSGVAPLVPRACAIILEAEVGEAEIEREILQAELVFSGGATYGRIQRAQKSGSRAFFPR